MTTIDDLKKKIARIETGKQTPVADKKNTNDLHDFSEEENEWIEKQTKSRKKKPKKPSRQRSWNQALYYIGKYDNSVDGLRKVLIRKVKRDLYFYPEINDEEAIGWINSIIDDFLEKGWINDNRFAEVKSNSLLRQGKSNMDIRGKLAQKGIDSVIIEKIIADVSSEQSELQRAATLTRKRRIGPYRSPDKQKERVDRDKGVLMRAGYSYDIASKIISCHDISDLEKLISSED